MHYNHSDGQKSAEKLQAAKLVFFLLKLKFNCRKVVQDKTAV